MAAEALLGADEPPAGQKIEGRSPWRLAYERLRKDRAAKIAFGTIIVIVLLAIFAPVFAALVGHGPNQQFIDIGENANGGPVPPSGTFWFGTDKNGRDLFVRVLYGARISLTVGVLATAISMALGVVFGLTAGYLGGFVDTFIARLIDVMLSIPFLVIAIAVAYICRPEPLAGHRHRGRAQLHLSRPHRPGPGDLDQGEGVHRGGQGPGREAVADHVHRPAAERDGAGHRVWHAADPAGDRGGGVAVVPRCGRAAADVRLGGR